MPEYESKGFVAYLDILGFSRMIGQDTLGEDFFSEYEQAISQAWDQNPFGCVNYSVFSDNVVLFSVSDEPVAFAATIHVTSSLFYKLLSIGAPVRGCVSHGPLIWRSIEDRGSIIYGPPVLEAVEYEDYQDWVGTMIGPSVRRFFSKEGDREANLNKVLKAPLTDEHPSTGLHNWILQRHEVPVHNQDTIDHYDAYTVLPHDWKEPTTESLVESLDACIDWLGKNSSYAPDPDAQRKYSRTEQFFKDVRRRAK